MCISCKEMHQQYKFTLIHPLPLLKTENYSDLPLQVLLFLDWTWAPPVDVSYSEVAFSETHSLCAVARPLLF